MSLKEAALGYAQNGIRIIPIKPLQKRPDLNNWTQEGTADPEIVLKWWEENPNRNIGFLCGHTHWVLDVDNPAAFQVWLQESGHSWVPTACVKTPSGGFHYYFRLGDFYVENSTSRPIPGAGESKSKGGQVLMPPSRFVGVSHDGDPVDAEYEWLTPLHEAVEAPQWLLDLMVDREPEPPRSTDGPGAQPWDEFNQRGDVQTELQRAGWTKVGERGDNEFWRKPGSTDPDESAHHATYHREKRTFYCWTPKAPPFEGTTGYGPFGVYLLLNEGDESPDAVQRACRKLEAAGYGEMPEDFSEFLGNEWKKPVGRATREEEEKDDTGFKLSYDLYPINYLEFAEEMQGYTVDWDVDEFFAHGQFNVIAAAKKSLKTGIACDLAVSLATGTPFLGHFPVNEKRNVMMLTAESGKGPLYDRFRGILHHRGDTIDRSTLGNLLLEWRVPKVGNAAHRHMTQKWSVINDIEALIFDPGYWMLSGDDASNAIKQAEEIRPIIEMCATMDISLYVVHHTTKRIDMGKQIGLEDIMFAGFAELAAGWLLINRWSEMSNQEGIHFHELGFNFGGRAGQFGEHRLDVKEQTLDGLLWAPKVWDFTRQDKAAEKLQAVQANEDAKAEELIPLIRQAFRRPDGTGDWTSNQMRDSGIGRSRAAFRACALMEERGEVERVWAGLPRAKRMDDGWRFLKKDEESSRDDV